MKKISRRKFVKDAAQVAALAVVAPAILQAKSMPALQFSQVALPYAYNALEPHIDALTMEIHYTKHHAGYVKNVNAAITEEKISYDTEKDFFANISKLSAKAHNNAGGAWNHNFFWQVMKPKGGHMPSGKIAEAINGAFGSFEKFKEEFTKAAMSRFGSGWAWLVNDNGKLKIGSTANQDNPLMDTSEFKGTPLLALDVWEHAYYLKYQNKRNEYVANWWSIINWDEAAKRLV
ncbi:MAG: superoxide dismutase [Bacteroidetes bacterium]|nr:superoxide dismutase [Bacteroidota bacterium]MBS1539637.1 superoxide dismutase [Bacteroidota bacterium]